MRKFVRKYFFNFIEPQKQWLNAMSKAGYRLVGVSPFGYTFEECEKGEYVYKVVYRGYIRRERSEPYMDKLLECGYNVFIKGLNRNMSSDVLRQRHREGTLYNPKFSPRDGYKDLLIIEKKNDGKPFETIQPKGHNIRDLKYMRNIGWFMMVLFTALIISTALDGSPIAIAFSVLSCLPFYFGIRLTYVVSKISSSKKPLNL